MTGPVEDSEIRSMLDTEFGRALTPLVAGIPGARAAVLSDIHGDAIDFVHRPNVSEIDVQLLGAQIGQTVLLLHAGAAKLHLMDPAVLVEASAGKFMAGAVATSYVVALLLDRRANLAAAMTAFTTARVQLDQLLMA